MMFLILMASSAFSSDISWGGHGTFSVLSLAVEDDSFELILKPTERGEFKPFSCDQFVINGKFDQKRLPAVYGFSEESHNESLVFLKAALERGWEIDFGTWGEGTFEARSCEINSYGFVAEPMSNDVFMGIHTWPSWN